ncbi:hypothetical protein E4U41_002575 [Claviceps citrina]|nr:hypothetical protein E4U41_002575 [Claviceps citrina]
MMQTIPILLLLLHTLAHLAVANVEKIIFTGPPPPSSSLNLLPLINLSHNAPSIHTELDRVFASDSSGRLLHGHSSWILVQNLTENQRYELRVCWSALEPTRFDIKAHSLDAVVEDPALLQSIRTFSASQQSDAHAADSSAAGLLDGSSLLIEIQAAADYFTDDKELMSSPPPVLVDLILDPFLLNVLPRSLLPTMGYLLLLAVTTWFVARRIASGLQSVTSLTESKMKKRD